MELEQFENLKEYLFFLYDHVSGIAVLLCVYWNWRARIHKKKRAEAEKKEKTNGSKLKEVEKNLKKFQEIMGKTQKDLLKSMNALEI
jgi:hypothetical protein